MIWAKIGKDEESRGNYAGAVSYYRGAMDARHRKGGRAIRHQQDRTEQQLHSTFEPGMLPESPEGVAPQRLAKLSAIEFKEGQAPGKCTWIDIGQLITAKLIAQGPSMTCSV
ncbi:MAG: hypothetical protein ACREFO_08665 [Acetobacteraceae bacterium]